MHASLSYQVIDLVHSLLSFFITTSLDKVINVIDTYLRHHYFAFMKIYLRIGRGEVENSSQVGTLLYI